MSNPVAVVSVDTSKAFVYWPQGQALGVKSDTKIAFFLSDVPVGTPLFTKHEWQDLTEKEYCDLAYIECEYGTRLELAFAVAKKLREKNGL